MSIGEPAWICAACREELEIFSDAGRAGRHLARCPGCGVEADLDTVEAEAEAALAELGTTAMRRLDRGGPLRERSGALARYRFLVRL